MEWPFLLHPEAKGPMDLHCIWQYSPVPASTTMPQRSLRWSCSIDILPVLSIRPQLLASPQHLRSLLHLTVRTAEVCNFDDRDVVSDIKLVKLSLLAGSLKRKTCVKICYTH